MLLFLVIWVVLMILWLFGSGFIYYRGPNPYWPAFGTGTLIPWLCVLILGLFVFGAVGTPVVIR